MEPLQNEAILPRAVWIVDSLRAAFCSLRFASAAQRGMIAAYS